jgi:hypothetical protein
MAFSRVLRGQQILIKKKEAMTTDALKSSSLLFILLLFKSFKQLSGHLVSNFRQLSQMMMQDARPQLDMFSAQGVTNRLSASFPARER